MQNFLLFPKVLKEYFQVLQHQEFKGLTCNFLLLAAHVVFKIFENSLFALNTPELLIILCYLLMHSI